MKRLITLCLLSIVGISNYGQDKSITEFDLYGRWVLELDEKGQRPEKLVYTRLTASDSISNNWIDISLLAFEKCEFASSRTRGYGYCGTQGGNVDKHTWVYDEKKEVIIIATVKTLLKEFSETQPEEYAEFGSPNWIEKTEIKVIRLVDNTIGLEKTPPLDPKTKKNPIKDPF